MFRRGLSYTKWLQAAHSEGWYGADGCPPNGSHNVRAQDLVKEVVDLMKADNPNFGWQDFDADGDGIVDNFTVIHAGAGQEGGGGAQGAYAIWSHASMINYPTGYLACTKGATGCPDRDIYVREYSMDPENIDIGVIAEEFGHAVFGLPDIYTTDYQASPSNWAIFEAGSWNGRLGGMQPAPFPLWARYMVGWANPQEVSYNDESFPVTIKVGQLSLPPKKHPVRHKDQPARHGGCDRQQGRSRAGLVVRCGQPAREHTYPFLRHSGRSQRDGHEHGYLLFRKLLEH